MYGGKNCVIDFRRNTKFIIMISTNENRNNLRTSISIPRLPCQSRRQNAIKQQQVSFFIGMDFFNILKQFSVSHACFYSSSGTGNKLELSSDKASLSLNIPLVHYHTTRTRYVFYLLNNQFLIINC